MRLRPALAGIRKRAAARFQRSGMTKQWLLAYVLLIFVPAMALLYAYYQRSTSILEEEVVKSMQQTMKQAGINLEYRLENIQGISDSLYLNPLLQSYLQSGNKDVGQLMEDVKNLRYMVDSLRPESGVYRVRLFVDDSVLYANEQVNFFALETLRRKPWYKDVLEANGGLVWTGVYRETFIDRGEVDVFSGARMLRHPDHYDQVLGVLSIDMADAILTRILDGISLSKQQQLYITDREGRLVLHPDRSKLGTAAELPSGTAERIRATADGTGTLVRDGTERYLIHTTVSRTGWKLIAEVPSDEIAGRAVKLNQSSAALTLLLISGLLLVLMFVLLAVIMKALNFRVQKVIRMIRKEGMDRYGERLEGAPGDLNLLQRSVDELIRRMKALMEEAYRAQVLEREAQLKALQAQINPHFLYNMLDTINWLAIGRGAEDISQMIDGLAKYFRLSLNKGKDLVSVEDELNLAAVYLELQQVRFPGSFRYEVLAGPEPGRYRMPKLTLQPIVENALLHGIRKSRSKSGTIRIRAWLEDGDLLLSVSDDGVGMEEETAARLLLEPHRAARSDSRGSSYGLYNVNERIKLFAGEPYGLAVKSRPGEGTEVTARLKAMAEEPGS